MIAITIAAKAGYFGSTAFAVRRAVRVKRLYARCVGHLRVVHPFSVAEYLEDLAQRTGRNPEGAAAM